MVPRMSGPVWSPMPAAMAGSPVPVLGPSISANRRRMASAARSASSGERGKMAMAASPKHLSANPACPRTSGLICPKYRLTKSKIPLEVSVSENDVRRLMSETYGHRAAGVVAEQDLGDFALPEQLEEPAGHEAGKGIRQLSLPADGRFLLLDQGFLCAVTFRLGDVHAVADGERGEAGFDLRSGLPR